MSLQMPRLALSKVFAHSRETYPEECCGFLIGVDGPTRKVLEVRRATNVHPNHREVRYTVDPREQLRLELDLQGTDRDLLGFYHSHPDHPGVPSTFDIERSWAVYSYLIVEVRRGRPVKARSFRIDPVTKTLREDRISIVAPRRRRRRPTEKAPRSKRRRAPRGTRRGP